MDDPRDSCPEDRVILFYDIDGNEVGRVEARDAVPGYVGACPPNAHIEIHWAGDVYP